MTAAMPSVCNAAPANAVLVPAPVSAWRRWRGLVLVAAVILLGNVVYLTGYADPNPLGPRSELEVSTDAGDLSGQPTIDPNNGYVTQALGRQAARQLSNGDLPFWNSYEGVGSPLLASPQSAALFPPTLLNLFDNGLFYEMLLLELVAGVATYLLVRRLGLHECAAIVAGIGFGLNGTFAWLQNGAILPIAFLPLILLGVERAVDRSQSRVSGGWGLIAVATALAIYSGWIETVWIFGLFVGAWVVLRFAQLEPTARRWFAQKVVSGGVAGLLLAAPLLVPFVGYLGSADVGGHSGSFSTFTLPAAAAPTLLGLPYAFGPIFAFNDAQGTIFSVWSNVGGFLSITLVFLAVLGSLGRTCRPLRLLLVGWIVLCVAKSFGPEIVAHAFNVLPGATSVAFYRYMPASLELAVMLLAAFAVDDVVTRKIDWRRPALVGMGVLVVVGITALLVHATSEGAGAGRYLGASITWAILVVVVLSTALARLRGRALVALILVFVVMDVGVTYATPTLSAPRSVTTDTSSVRWLTENLGNGRFFSFYPIAANYGSYFDLASVASTDAPVPELWSKMLRSRLGRKTDVNAFSFIASSLVAMARHPQLLRELGTPYVLLAPGGEMGAPLGPDLRLVHRDAAAKVYRLTGALPYFDVRSGSCRTEGHGRQSVSLRCDRSARLVRRELFFPGWTATVNGRAVPIRESRGLLQSVNVPGGSSTVRFAYEPPHWRVAVVLFALGLIWVCAAPVARRLAVRRRRVDA